MEDISNCDATQTAVVLHRDIDSNTTLAELKDIITDTGASDWDLRPHKEFMELNLELRFQDIERAQAHIARYNNSAARSTQSSYTNEGHGPRRLFPVSNEGHGSPTLTASTTGRILTPNTTTIDGFSETASTAGISAPSAAVPWPGKTYKIQHRASGRLMTLVEGQVRLQLPETTKAAGGCHWVCVGNNGWLGFRSPVSGTYVGHDRRGHIWSRVQHHKADEQFCVRHHPDGGYIILVRHHDGCGLWPVTVDEDISETLLYTKDGEDQWLFEVV